jgi:CubicO group peptidase (beta-lactamase class C family)
MRTLILSALIVAGLHAEPVAAQISPADSRSAVEAGLLPPVVFDDGAEAWTLPDRMARWNVPGVSIAVIDNGRIVWAQGYGVRVAGESDPVRVETRFQAASISKPVAAAAALALVQDGVLTLDGDVNQTLESWRLPDTSFTANRALTLRDLLSHTGGTTVHGFPGYAQGAPVPTPVEVLNGVAPANTDAVTSWAQPGQGWRYSGGGYQIVQQMIEDATDQSFADIVNSRVLAPADMTNSGYDTPAPGVIAHGHGSDGQPIAGGWHTYPEQAAAGLWTTPSDLARFGLALAAAYRGEDDRLMDHATATIMMTPVMEEHGVGPAVSGEGEALAVSHGGANEGFRAFWVIHPATGDGAVVMTNGDEGSRLAMEVVRAVARVHGWPDYAPAARTTYVLDPGVLASRAGIWSTAGAQPVVFNARQDGERLVFETERGTFVFTAVSATAMVAGEIGASARFIEGEDGSLTLSAFGMELRQQDAEASPASGS